MGTKMSDTKTGTVPLMFLKPRRADKQLIREAVNHFDGLQIGASDAIATIELVKNSGKPFFVDPMAYMFVLPPAAVIDEKSGKVRPSLSSLAQRYSTVLEQTIGKRAISPEDITSKLDILDEIAHNALAYQRSKINGQLNLFPVSDYYDKYQLLDDDGEPKPQTANALVPWVVISPFFYFTDTEDPWYSATLRCADLATKHLQPGESLFATLLMDQRLLDSPDKIRRIIADFTNTKISGIFIWINGMDEDAASTTRLLNLLALVSGLKAAGKSVLKMHGGYFSVLMHSFGLSGFSCALSYRTSRNIMSYKWRAPSQPAPKFYIPSLHRAYALEEAAHILKMFPSTRCTCAVCRDAYGSDFTRLPDRMKKVGFCEKHFLNVRKHELNSVRNGQEGMLASLDETLARLGQDHSKEISHLAKWRKAVTDFSTAA